MKQKEFPGQPLDLLEASYFRCQIPIIYCNITFKTKINIKRLKKAIELTTSVVPEIICSYNIKKNCWYDSGFNIDNIIEDNKINNYQWDLTKGPQLKVFVSNNDKAIKIAISHLLCDGTGFKEYLYLLCNAYNNINDFPIYKNNREPKDILKTISKKKIKKYLNFKTKDITIPIKNTGNNLYSIDCPIEQEQFIKIKNRAHKLECTINDMVLAAYAKALSTITGSSDMNIACPVNLRKFIQPETLRICNLTGIYNCSIQIDKNKELKDILNDVQNEMKKQKQRNEYFYKLIMLHKVYKILPLSILKRILLKTYLIPPVSYTNIGIIDEKKLLFEDSKISTCYITNSYRKFPSFQMAISTYNNICTLSSNIIGSKENSKIAKEILLLTKTNLNKL